MTSSKIRPTFRHFWGPNVGRSFVLISVVREKKQYFCKKKVVKCWAETISSRMRSPKAKPWTTIGTLAHLSANPLASRKQMPFLTIFYSKLIFSSDSRQWCKQLFKPTSKFSRRRMYRVNVYILKLCSVKGHKSLIFK